MINAIVDLSLIHICATEDERWTDRIVSSSGDWSGNICDFYFRVYNRIAQDINCLLYTSRCV